MRDGIHRAGGSSAAPAPHTDKKQLLLISDLLFVFHFTFTVRLRGDQREPAEVRPPRTAPLGSEGMTASLQHRDPVAAVPPHPLISSPPLGSELRRATPQHFPFTCQASHRRSHVAASNCPIYLVSATGAPRRDGHEDFGGVWGASGRGEGKAGSGGEGGHKQWQACIFFLNSQRCLHSRAAGGGRWGRRRDITQVAFTASPSPSPSSSPPPPSAPPSDGEASQVLLAERGGSAVALSPLINPRVSADVTATKSCSGDPSCPFSVSRASVSGSAVVAVLVSVAARRNAQAPRTARHHRRPSGRGRQSRFAGRRRDAMREHLLQFYACAHARWLKAPYYGWLFIFTSPHHELGVQWKEGNETEKGDNGFKGIVQSTSRSKIERIT